MEEIERYYDLNADHEWNRLDRHRTEFAVTMRALRDYLPSQPIDVLDIGGGPGRYSIELAKLGDRVTLFDLSRASLEYAQRKAMEAGVELTAYVQGNALDLSRFETGSFAVVLLLGPLYHLLSERERRQAVRESRRVLKPHGIILASFITRYAPFRWAGQNDPKWMFSHKQLLKTGIFTPSMIPREAARGFTTSYFSEPSEIKPLMEQEYFETLGVTGCGGLLA